MRLFVAGATGALGRPAVARLVEAGHEVRGVARSPARAELLRALGAEPVALDVFHMTTLREALAGCDAALRLTTHIPSPAKMRKRSAWGENDRLRTEGSRALVEAALAAGVPRLVQESITFVYPSRGEVWIDETVPPEPLAPNLPSALVAEAEGERYAREGGTAITLRFGAFYGPEAQSAQSMARLARWWMSTSPGPRDSFVSSIHTDDAAAAVVAALDVASGVYNVVDDEPLTRVGYDEALAAAVGVGRLRRLPLRLVRLAAGVYAPLLESSQRVSNARFKAATSWMPEHRSAREGWAAIVRVWSDEEKARA